MRYVVTGGTGFVGGALVRLLRERGHEVVALVRAPARAEALAAAGVTLHRGDVTDAQSVRAALDSAGDADGLFHVAGWYKVGARDTTEGWRINVEGTRTVLGAAADAGTPRVVYTSTLAVNGDTEGSTVDETYRITPGHPAAYATVYDASKERAHAIAARLAAGGAPIVTVMPGGVYGPGDTSQVGALIAAVARGRRVVATDGPRMCQAHVDDVAAGHLLAMERGRPGESYMLAGPQVGLGDLLDLVAEVAGTRRPVRTPPRLVAASAAVARALGRVVSLPPTYSAESLRVATMSYLGSPAKAERELGWSARPLREGLEQTVAALRGDAAPHLTTG